MLIIAPHKTSQVYVKNENSQVSKNTQNKINIIIVIIILMLIKYSQVQYMIFIHCTKYSEHKY